MLDARVTLNRLPHKGKLQAGWPPCRSSFGSADRLDPGWTICELARNAKIARCVRGRAEKGGGRQHCMASQPGRELLLGMQGLSQSPKEGEGESSCAHGSSWKVRGV